MPLAMKIFVFSSRPWGWRYHPSMSSAKAIVLPPDFSGFSFDTNILAALALKLPLKSTNNSLSLVQEWFSKEYLNVELKDIQTLTIPSNSTLWHLTIQLPIAMENGFISLVVPQDLSQLFLPLWVIEYWKWLSKFILRVTVWKSAVAWLSGNVHVLTGKGTDTRHLDMAVKEAQDLLALMPLGGQVQSEFVQAAVEIHRMSPLLSSGWIGTDLMDLMLECLSEQAAIDLDIADFMQIRSLLLMRTIIDAFGASYKGRSIPILNHIVEKITSQRLKNLFLIGNMDENHWVTVEVDIDARCIWIGDSLNNDLKKLATTQLVVALKAWLQEALGTLQVTNDLCHGTQLDGYSCGICAINSIEHRIWPNTLLWSPQHRSLIRTEQFCAISWRYLDQVSKQYQQAILWDTSHRIYRPQQPWQWRQMTTN